MSAEQASNTPTFPEHLISSRQVGHIPTELLPWMRHEPKETVAVSELTFPDGMAYVASAGTKQLNKLTEAVRKHDTQVDEHGFSRLDTYFLRACHLEANGEAMHSDRIQSVKSQAADFEDFQIRDYREAPTPNARRVYYAIQAARQAWILTDGDATITDHSPLIIRLGITDKKHQLDFLKHISAYSRRQASVRLRTKG